MSSNKPGSIYRTARWKKLRLTVLAEEPTCHWCHNEPSTQVDHVIEIAAGGEPYERSNLADPIMSFSRDPVSSAYISHVYQVREGARGAEGGHGGGCGCN